MTNVLKRDHIKDNRFQWVLCSPSSLVCPKGGLIGVPLESFKRGEGRGTPHVLSLRQITQYI